LGKALYDYEVGTTMSACTDFTFYDPNNRVTKIDDAGDPGCTGIKAWEVARDEECYVYKDMGGGYFGAEFVLEWRMDIDNVGNYGNCSMITLSNTAPESLNTHFADDYGISFYILKNLARVLFRLKDEANAGSEASAYSVTLSTTNVPICYMRMIRDSDLLTLQFYTDAARTTKYIADMTTPCGTGGSNHYRYLYVCQSRNLAGQVDWVKFKAHHWTVVEKSRRYFYDKQPFTNPLIITDLQAAPVGHMQAASTGNLYIYQSNLGNENCIEAVGLSEVTAEDCGVPSNGGTYVPYAWDIKGDDITIVHRDNSFNMQYIEYDGDDFTTENKSLTLDSTWTQAIWPTPRDIKYDPTTGRIVGFVTAWSSTPAEGYKAWWCMWDYSTGNLVPDSDTIIRLTTGANPYSFWVFDPDDGTKYWIFDNTTQTLEHKVVATGADGGSDDIDFSTVLGGVGITGMDVDINDNLFVGTATNGGSLWMFEGVSNTLRSI
jgi:hypothetical protein